MCTKISHRSLSKQKCIHEKDKSGKDDVYNFA